MTLKYAAQKTKTGKCPAGTCVPHDRSPGPTKARPAPRKAIVKVGEPVTASSLHDDLEAASQGQSTLEPGTKFKI